MLSNASSTLPRTYAGRERAVLNQAFALWARLSIEGRQIEAPANWSILQAFLHAGEILAEGVGCMGQGCRVMVRGDGDQEVKTVLANTSGPTTSACSCGG